MRPSAAILFPPTPQSSSDIDDWSSSDDEVPHGLERSSWLQEMQMNPEGPRFFGKSSGVMIVKDAMDLKHGLMGGSPPPLSLLVDRLRARRPDCWHVNSVSGGSAQISDRN